MGNALSKIKPIKTGKEIGTIYCLGCKDNIDSFKPQEIKMKNKVLRKKSNSVVSQTSKPRFLEEKRNNKK